MDLGFVRQRMWLVNRRVKSGFSGLEFSPVILDRIFCSL
jgi:hypothetical protein